MVVQSTIDYQWFGKWLGVEKVTSHSLGWSLPSTVTYTPPFSLSQARIPKTLLNHWGRVPYICVSKWRHPWSDRGLSPVRQQVSNWTNVSVLLLGSLGGNFNEIPIHIQIFWFKKTHLKMSSTKWGPFYLGSNDMSPFLFIRFHLFFRHPRSFNSVQWSAIRLRANAQGAYWNGIPKGFKLNPVIYVNGLFPQIQYLKMRVIFIRPCTKRTLCTVVTLLFFTLVARIMTTISYTMYNERHLANKSIPTTIWPAFEDLSQLKERMSSHRNCRETVNFVYIKMIKCASETLAAAFRRFGYVRDLAFALPLGTKYYIGWPYVLNETFYRANKTKEFNIMVDHAVYNEKAMGKIMPADTVYITSIRHPYSQFKSLMRYYKLAEIVGIPKERDPVTEYLSDLPKYEAIYKSHEAAKKRHCIPDNMSMAKNQMAFNLGFPIGFPPGTPDQSGNYTYIKQWLHHIEEKFKLIMLVEYLDESLVLLKRLMCWGTKDILYFVKNEGKYTYKNEINYKENLRKYKNFSNVDFILYEHFEYIFWKMVSLQGRGFVEEVEHFKRVRSVFREFCDKPKKAGESKTFEATDWSERFTVDADYCHLVHERLMNEVKRQYEKNSVKVVQPKGNVFVCWVIQYIHGSRLW